MYESDSHIKIFVKEYSDRINNALQHENDPNFKSPFPSFAEKKLSLTEISWLQENDKIFLKDTANETLKEDFYLTALGFITSMTYSSCGEHIVVGYSTGYIEDFSKRIYSYFENEIHPKIWYPMFHRGLYYKKITTHWLLDNYDRFLKDTPNDFISYRWYFSELGAITSMTYSPSGNHVIVGHSSGLIQMRHGSTGIVLSTLRKVQFPPKPVYSIKYSLLEERVAYAACTDGAVYRIEIPNITPPVDSPPEYCIKADPALDCLQTQFHGSPSPSSYATPFITQRSPALSLAITEDQSKMIVGYGDTSIKIYDVETQEAETTFKVHKLRMQFIPKKLQRMHSGQVCALRCHEQRPFVFASGAWDNTLRIWDTRCKVGCVMTFEGVNICGDSIDLKRDHCIVGSWKPTEALTVWDLVAKKQQEVIRVQNRRPDVDGEYIYSCRYWRSDEFNRKGKYAIIGGSGTSCVEVINLHNRYIACSYPVKGTITAITSHEERIAFGGTYPVFTIVSFHDPKHEKYEREEEQDYHYSKKSYTMLQDDDESGFSSEAIVDLEPEENVNHLNDQINEIL